MTLFRLAAALALLSTGCATTLATMDTARTTPVKHVRIDGAYGLYIPTGPFVTAIDAGINVARNAHNGTQALGPAEAQKLYDAALALALMPPAAVTEYAIRTGITEDSDIGLKYATTALRADAKYRFLHLGEDDTGRSHHMALDLGVSKYLFSNPVFDVLDYVQMGDFSRWDIDAALLYSFEVKRVFALYTGVKYVFTRFSVDENLMKLQDVVGELGLPNATDRITTNMHYGGALIGVMGGYKYVFVNLELNAGYTYARPRMYSFVDKQIKERNVGGVTLYPAIGIVVKI